MFLNVYAFANSPSQNLGITNDQLSTASVCTVIVSNGVPYHLNSWNYAMMYKIECNNGLTAESETTYNKISQTEKDSQNFMTFVLNNGFKKADPFLSVSYPGSALNAISKATFYFVKN